MQKRKFLEGVPRNVRKTTLRKEGGGGREGGCPFSRTPACPASVNASPSQCLRRARHYFARDFVPFPFLIPRRRVQESPAARLHRATRNAKLDKIEPFHRDDPFPDEAHRRVRYEGGTHEADSMTRGGGYQVEAIRPDSVRDDGTAMRSSKGRGNGRGGSPKKEARKSRGATQRE